MLTVKTNIKIFSFFWISLIKSTFFLNWKFWSLAADEKLNIHPKPLWKVDSSPPLCFYFPSPFNENSTNVEILRIISRCAGISRTAPCLSLTFLITFSNHIVYPFSLVCQSLQLIRYISMSQGVDQTLKTLIKRLQTFIKCLLTFIKCLLTFIKCLQTSIKYSNVSRHLSNILLHFPACFLQLR